MKVRITAPGLPAILRGLDVLSAQIPKVADDSGRTLAQEILDASQNVSPTVPEDTGALISTGRVEQQRSSGQFASGWAVKYGGIASPATGKYVHYAIHVHDDLRPKKYTKPGSGAKFLDTHADRLWAGHLQALRTRLSQTIRLTVG